MPVFIDVVVLTNGGVGLVIRRIPGATRASEKQPDGSVYEDLRTTMNTPGTGVDMTDAGSFQHAANRYAQFLDDTLSRFGSKKAPPAQLEIEFKGLPDG